MVASQQRDQANFTRGKALQSAVSDQRLRVPVVTLVADQRADIVQQGGGVEQFMFNRAVAVQRRQLVAYDTLRNRVGDTLGRIAETVSGVRVIRAYHHSEVARGDLHGAIGDQLAAQLKARFFFSIMFPMSDLFGGLLLAT